MALRDAVKYYQRQDLQAGGGRSTKERCRPIPALGDAYFYLGNSYDNQFKPSRKGDAGERQAARKGHRKLQEGGGAGADADHEAARDAVPVAAYGAEKAERSITAGADPAQDDRDGSDRSGNYYYLANVHEQSGNYEEAEKLLLKAREMKPGDPTVYTTLAGFYNRQGQFEKTMEALEARAQKEPNNPEAIR
jgi:tetratricopeptide (TPR) repeat protein